MPSFGNIMGGPWPDDEDGEERTVIGEVPALVAFTRGGGEDRPTPPNPMPKVVVNGDSQPPASRHPTPPPPLPPVRTPPPRASAPNGARPMTPMPPTPRLPSDGAPSESIEVAQDLLATPSGPPAQTPHAPHAGDPHRPMTKRERRRARNDAAKARAQARVAAGLPAFEGHPSVPPGEAAPAFATYTQPKRSATMILAAILAAILVAIALFLITRH